MTDDIVARLREEGFVTHMAKLTRESKILHDAADEIERLRNGGCAEAAEIQRMNAILRDRCNRLMHKLQELEAREAE